MGVGCVAQGDGKVFFFGLVRDNCWDGVICIALGARMGVQMGVFPVVIANASQSSTRLPLLTQRSPPPRQRRASPLQQKQAIRGSEHAPRAWRTLRTNRGPSTLQHRPNDGLDHRGVGQRTSCPLGSEGIFICCSSDIREFTHLVAQRTKLPACFPKSVTTIAVIAKSGTEMDGYARRFI